MAESSTPSSTSIHKRYTFAKQEKLGEGSYDVIYKAYDTYKDNKIIALEMIKSNVKAFKVDIDGKKESYTENIRREIEDEALRDAAILTRLNKHPNVIELYRVENAKEGLYLVLEYMKFDLEKLMNLRTLTRKETTLFLKHILMALDYCHSRGVLHRDLKPANILIDENISTLKFADFGLARYFTTPTRPYSPDMVSQFYRAPKILRALDPCDYHTSANMLSVGCIFAEMVHAEGRHTGANRMMFYGTSEDSQANSIFRLSKASKRWPV